MVTGLPCQGNIIYILSFELRSEWQEGASYVTIKKNNMLTWGSTNAKYLEWGWVGILMEP